MGFVLFTVLFYSFPCMAFAYSDLSGLPLISVFPFSSGSPFFPFFMTVCRLPISSNRAMMSIPFRIVAEQGHNFHTSRHRDTVSPITSHRFLS